jgi:hypothetical protein
MSLGCVEIVIVGVRMHIREFPAEIRPATPRGVHAAKHGPTPAHRCSLSLATRIRRAVLQRVGCVDSRTVLRFLFWPVFTLVIFLRNEGLALMLFGLGHAADVLTSSRSGKA